VGYKVIGSDLHEENLSKCEEMMIPRTAGGYSQGFIIIDYTGPNSPWKHCVAMFWEPSKGVWANKVVDKKDCKTLEQAGVESCVKQLQEDSLSISKIIKRQGYAWVARELANIWRKTKEGSFKAMNIANMAKDIASFEEEYNKEEKD